MKVSASLLSSDLLNLEKEIEVLAEAGVSTLHIDIMDGHFVPNIAFGIDIVRQITKVSTLPINIHLMIDNPERFIDLLSSPKIGYIIVHSEGNRDIKSLFGRIKANDVNIGIALNPQTQVMDIREYLEMVDMALVMGVHPGFGGQTLIPSTLRKIKQLKDIRKDLVVGIDGGINDQTVSIVNPENPDILVVGSYLFNRDKDHELQDMREKLRILQGA